MSSPDNNPSQQNKLASQSISYWKIFRILLSRWYWVAATVIISYIAAEVVIRYSEEIYNTNATVKLESADQSPIGAASIPMSYRYMKNNLIESEGLIMKSEAVIVKAIERLDYKITYYIEGRIRTSEMYPAKPFKINIIQQDSSSFSRDLYHVKPSNSTTFLLAFGEKNTKFEKYSYGQVINMGNMLFSIISPIPVQGTYSFRFNAAEDFKWRAIAGLSFQEKEKNTNVMLVSHTDISPRFSADLLNAIVEQYVVNDADEKKRSAIQTINYLDDQIRALDSSVNKSGDSLANFQKRTRIIDPVTDKQSNAGKQLDFEQRIADLQLEGQNIEQLRVLIQANDNKNPLALNLAGPGGALVGLVNEFNALIAQREQKLKGFQPASAPVKAIDVNLAETKRALVASVAAIRDANKRSLSFVQSQLGSTRAVLNELPSQQNDFAKLENNYKTSAQLQTILYERKLTAQIARAAVTPGAKVLSKAEQSLTPISPIKKKIYTSYMFLGVVAGLGLILLVRILNPFIYDVETVEGLTSTPIIGIILRFPEKIQTNFRRILSLEKPKSIFAESVRSVRTNLSFMASHKETKVICVTSEISGEGKSFVTVNLAGTLAIIDKKVIVIAADLRRSKLHKTFGSENKKGLSTYLSLKDGIDDIIGHDEDHFIDYITSGPVPPNPSELLHSPMMNQLVEELRTRYEYIIIDTAPVGLVSDSIPLIRNSDINLFIIRSGVSKFRAATIPDRLSKEYSLNNIAIILNSFGDEKLHSNIYTTNYAHGTTGAYYYSDYTGYGNYGYYDNSHHKKWWQFWKK